MAIQSNSASGSPSYAKPADALQNDGLFPDNEYLTSYRRVIVLVPNIQFDEQRLIERTISLASLNRAEVLFIGLSSDRTEIDRTHHRLGVIAAKVRGAVVAYAQVLPDDDWITALRKVIRPTDSVLLPTDQASSLEGQLTVMRIPVFQIADLRPDLKSRLLRAVSRLLYESAPLLIIVGFLWLQIQIANQTAGFLNVVLTVLTLIVELGLIVIWSLFLE